MKRGLILLLLLILLMCAAMCYACALARAYERDHTTGGSSPDRPQLRPASPRRVAWPATPALPRVTGVGRTIARAAVRRGEFGPPTAQTQAQIKQGARSLVHGATDTATIEAAITSVVRTEVTLAAQRVRGRRPITMASTGLEPPLTAARVLAAAQRQRVPPVSFLRELLISAGLRTSQVRAVHADPAAAASITELLSGDFTPLFDADLSSRTNSMRAQVRAMKFEDTVSDLLTAQVGRGAYQRENDRRGVAATSSLTPDFLFKEPIMINGHIIKWLDAKNYYWYGSPLTARSVHLQAEKYTEAFGPGAFVFRHGADPQVVIGTRPSEIPPVILSL